jgi:hypothetical protein
MSPSKNSRRAPSSGTGVSKRLGYSGDANAFIVKSPGKTTSEPKTPGIPNPPTQLTIIKPRPQAPRRASAERPELLALRIPTFGPNGRQTQGMRAPSPSIAHRRREISQDIRSLFSAGFKRRKSSVRAVQGSSIDASRNLTVRRDDLGRRIRLKAVPPSCKHDRLSRIRYPSSLLSPPPSVSPLPRVLNIVFRNQTSKAADENVNHWKRESRTASRRLLTLTSIY